MFVLALRRFEWSKSLRLKVLIIVELLMTLANVMQFTCWKILYLMIMREEVRGILTALEVDEEVGNL